MLQVKVHDTDRIGYNADRDQNGYVDSDWRGGLSANKGRGTDGIMRAVLSVAAIVAITACNQTGGAGYDAYDHRGYRDDRRAGVNIADTLMTTDAPEYASGGVVTVRLANRFGRLLGYNLCRARLERLDGDGEWRPARTTLAEVCTAEIRTLRPGQSVTYSFKAEPRSRPGEYRISAELEDLQARTRFTAVSSTFRLSRDGD